ncbi:Gfo/Idh/MocA family protein [Actinoplanes siamensis]|uniref:Oxidoreductase n=1 Tax=Actinoplanes siamensis TaxID=1223317 RepID=A0A919TN33_9ACTN|nr:Gfo/Idh/MocA family oxidoreductase [Actinoplanes siamensis]GIF08229.1 oxidoreductase [Actinoplanes siamensis]
MRHDGGPLRIGLLGAARISRVALAEPARTGQVRLVGIAARDRRRAEEFAAEHGVEQVLESYPAVIGSPVVEAVYNPLPNGLHGRWTRRAVQAGKHVLVEKPFAADAEEAAEVAALARRAGVVVLEGFHYYYHPVARRLRAALASGELGRLRHAEAVFHLPAPPDDDVRWSLPLAGGATMDLGCYCLHALRGLAPWAGGEPAVVAARAEIRAGRPGVDERLSADLRYPSGATGTIRCDMAATVRRAVFRLVGTAGTITATEFVKPQVDDRVVVEIGGARRVEHLGRRSTYAYQLAAFTAAIRHGAPVPTGADDAVATMRLIDDCYRGAGLPLRPRSTEDIPRSHIGDVQPSE